MAVATALLRFRYCSFVCIVFLYVYSFGLPCHADFHSYQRLMRIKVRLRRSIATADRRQDSVEKHIQVGMRYVSPSL